MEESNHEPYIDPKGSVRVRRKGNNNVPDYLGGLYTSIREANKAIAIYSKEVEVKKPIKDKTAKLESLD